ncbi:hypothetical protein RRG08_056036 [Elysia crispata]|uniref:Uncharacterized protein n=1 Tax=Elysia crispata TaxID=231223 RepID=A0AAE1AHQ0_9GAST|nr:hypothetical protein RRG08_056036 [Elysia crispata]
MKLTDRRIPSGLASLQKQINRASTPWYCRQGPGGLRIFSTSRHEPGIITGITGRNVGGCGITVISETLKTSQEVTRSDTKNRRAETSSISDASLGSLSLSKSAPRVSEQCAQLMLASLTPGYLR